MSNASDTARTVTVTVRPSAIGALEGRVEALNKRLARLGAPLIEVVPGAIVDVPVYPVVDGFVVSDAPPLYKVTGQLVEVTYQPGELRVPGWRFAARVEHGEAGNIIARAPGYEGEISEELRTAASTCDHCKTERKRIDTMLLVSDDGARTMRVGRTCLKDFTGHNCAGMVMALSIYGELYGRITDGGWMDEGWLGGGFKLANMATSAFLAQACATVEAEGFVKGGETRDRVSEACVMFGTGRAADAVRKGHVEPTSGHYERAAAIIEWLEGADTRNDYMWNLRAAALCSQVGRNTGLLASAPSAFDRHLGREAKKAADAKRGHEGVNEYIGKPGDKIGRKLSAADKRKGAEAHAALTVTLERVIACDGNYGTSYLHIFRTAEGNTLTWFGSGGAAHDLRWATDFPGGLPYAAFEAFPVGSTFEIAATIKDHRERNGVKQTVINRVKRLTGVEASEAIKVELEAIEAAKAADAAAEKAAEAAEAGFVAAFVSMAREYASQFGAVELTDKAVDNATTVILLLENAKGADVLRKVFNGELRDGAILAAFLYAAGFNTFTLLYQQGKAGQRALCLEHAKGVIRFPVAVAS